MDSLGSGLAHWRSEPQQSPSGGLEPGHIDLPLSCVWGSSCCVGTPASVESSSCSLGLESVPGVGGWRSRGAYGPWGD